MKRFGWIGLCAVMALASDMVPDSYMAHIRVLASPELKGRRTGTPECDRAAEYIAQQFKKAGLQPIGGSYFQQYEVTAKTGVGKDDALVISDGGKSKHLRETVDFIPLNLSGSGSVNGQVVFAGYGISAPEYHYDDYSGLDAEGKIVLVLRREPKEMTDKNQFTSSGIESKVVNAKLHGARGVLLVNRPPDEDALDKFQLLTATGDYGMVVAQVTMPVADQLLGPAHESIAQVVGEIDRENKPHPFAIPAEKAELRVALTEETRGTRNVVGYLPGETPEYIVIGAHYDHLGLGEQDSLDPSMTGTVHPGADDNASGTAGVIELAGHFARMGKQKRGFVFLCFSGEEEGLLGSAWYVNHPLKPLSDDAAMINMDMIGRLRDNKVYVGGVGTGSTFKPIVTAATDKEHFAADESQMGGYGASDHTSFTTKQIPTLFFFSGLHSDYHKASDTADKINAPDAVRLLDEVADIAESLAEAPQRPEFIRVQEPAHAGSVSSSGSGGYGPYFGSIPDFGGPANGVRFSDVRDGSPAAKAGFKAGDVMVEFDGKPIQNLYDFTYALRAHKPGDTVKVKVLRDGKPVEADVLLTKRN
jgi:hypothetical protein